MIMFSSNEIKQTVKMKQCLKTAHSLFQTTCNTSLDLPPQNRVRLPSFSKLQDLQEFLKIKVTSELLEGKGIPKEEWGWDRHSISAEGKCGVETSARWPPLSCLGISWQVVVLILTTVV